MFFNKQLLIRTKIYKINMREIKTFAFLDSETTGLPHLENCKTKITELCIVVVHSSHLNMGVFPRVQNKLGLCFNPGKYINKDVSTITGLDNFLLENQTNFRSDTVKLINRFLETQEKPICLVAHNGKRFDFPILRTEIHRTGEQFLDDVLCVDSLEAFRDLHKLREEAAEIVQETEVTSTVAVPVEFQDGYDELLCQIADEMEEKKPGEKQSVEEIIRINETTPQKKIFVRKDLFGSTSSEGASGSKATSVSKTVIRKLNFGRISFKLGDLYQRLTLKEVLDAHKAECDVNMLIECAAIYGEEFVKWAKEKAKPFNEIPLLQIGKKIGT